MPAIYRVFDLLSHVETMHDKEDLVAGKQQGKWVKYSTTQFIDTVNQVSRGLLALGVAPGDKVGIMSPNRPEWNICDFAIMQIGAVQVPLYPTLSESDISFILKDAGIRVIFVSDANLIHKVRKAGDPELNIFSFDPVETVPSWKQLLESDPGQNQPDLESYRSKILPGDLVTLIYTSGTTGTPKGVMLTHDNLVSNVVASSTLYPKHFVRALSFLPLSHIFERMVIYMYFYLGISVYYAQSMETIVDDIKEVKPNGFTTVPRLLEKVYDRIVEKGTQLTGIKKSLFFWALDLGLRYELDGKNGLFYEIQLSLANILIFKKWREALGGNIAAIVSGGAALQPRLARVFTAARIPVLEGYGLTETSPVITVNGLGKDQRKFGSVGKPIAGVKVKIADDGEVLCKGPNVMKGYYKRPDLTSEVIDADGFFHTGDIGELTTDGFLRITDRKKEIFKTAGGKYIAPQVLENKFKESPFIEQVLVVGENRKFPAALIVPAFAALQEWCKNQEINCGSNLEMVTNPEVIRHYNEIIAGLNEGFGHWEQVKRIILLPKEWTIDAGEMTPKMSLKRKVILEKNHTVIENIYKNAENIEIRE
ncbi:MAG TPA: long-chain fatty acid--CoA ligase [Sphingobacteriaceae bacterium]